MSEVLPAPEGKRPRPSAEAKKAAAEAARRANATPDARRFLLLWAQLAVLVALTYRLYPPLFALGATVLAGFTVHYWLPFRFKEPAWIALSIAGGAVVLGAPGGAVGNFTGAAGAVLLAVLAGLVIFAIVASPAPYWARLLGVAGVFVAVMGSAAYARRLLPLPPRSYQVFGVLFMLNIFPYLYEARHFKERARLLDFARYFFVLPGVKLIAPIPDFQKLGQSLYKRGIHESAQEGVRFLVRGAVQFAIYRLTMDHVHYARTPDEARSLHALVVHLAGAYMLYFRTSGMIHMFVGVWHLFGYDMPECYRWFACAHSPLDYWRRTNIYFKDAMTKVVYFPVYFALRKRGDLAAKLVAIAAVFAGSWFVHIWGFAWYSDLNVSVWRTILVWPQESLFWAVLGLASVVNMLIEHRAEQRAGAPAPRRAAPPAADQGWLARATRHVVSRVGLPPGMHPARGIAQIAATQLLIAVLFSLDHAPSIRAWLYTMRFWNA